MSGISRRGLLAAAAAGGASPALAHAGPRTGSVAGPVQPSWTSLQQHYRTPDWFRDAKFGIWAHWSAQCVPEFGDWYGRRMYIQGDPFYEHHVKTYGHPSKFGFIEIENLWRAENWRPEELMELYVKAGAKYFVALANHHDNLDTFDSAHHPWNTLRVGPKTDIIGTWAPIARRNGLKFGVSNHSAHSWHWWQTAYGYDAEGPLAGVRYDAYHLRKADGRGRWWDGLDPQQLYNGPHYVIPDGIDSIQAADAWHDAHDGQWTEDPPFDDPIGYSAQWLARSNDLVDKYRPDFIYMDDTELPLGPAGLMAAAHYYNASLAWHGSPEVVLTGKKLAVQHRGAITEDFERGYSDVIRPDPWQTCSCIGNWHYDRSIYERHGYKTPMQVQQMLADIVSKNGNLLLSIPLKGDGTIDPDEHAFLEGMAAWMQVNGEAIYGSRPWLTFGEGPTAPPSGMFVEQNAKPYTAEDVRYTQKGGALYAVLMAPAAQGGTLRLRAVTPDRGRVGRVDLLGGAEALAFRPGPDGVDIDLPPPRPADAGGLRVLRLQGEGLVASRSNI